MDSPINLHVGNTVFPFVDIVRHNPHMGYLVTRTKALTRNNETCDKEDWYDYTTSWVDDKTLGSIAKWFLYNCSRLYQTRWANYHNMLALQEQAFEQFKQLGNEVITRAIQDFMARPDVKLAMQGDGQVDAGSLGCLTKLAYPISLLDPTGRTVLKLESRKRLKDYIIGQDNAKTVKQDANGEYRHSLSLGKEDLAYACLVEQAGKLVVSPELVLHLRQEIESKLGDYHMLVGFNTCVESMAVNQAAEWFQTQAKKIIGLSSTGTFDPFDL